MSETIKSIIFAIFGLVVLIFGAITSAGAEVIVFGALLTATAVGCLIYDLIKAKKK